MKPPDQGPPHGRSFTRHDWLFVAFILAATVVAYLPALNGEFIWDDDSFVTENTKLRDLSGLWQIWFKIGALPQYYPLVYSSFWVEYHLWGLHPFGYHLVNVFLHATAVVFLWRVLVQLEIGGAGLVAAIFALHPVQVESVAWITERKNVLSGVFYFAAALTYLRFDAANCLQPSGRRRWDLYLWAWLLFVAALLSKTVTCSLPAALLLAKWWKQNRLSRQDVLRIIPFFVIGAALASLTPWMENRFVGAHGAAWSLTFFERCLVAGRAVWFYAAKILWPVQLTFIYPRWTIDTSIWWQWIFPLTAVGMVGTLWLLRRRVGRGPITAVLFFVGTLGPALGFINVYPMRYSFVADHFQYLASLGIITVVVAGVVKSLARFRLWEKSIGYALLAVPLLLLATLTWRQCRMYADLETLWRVTIARNPQCWIAHNNLGMLLADRGVLDEAIRHYEVARGVMPEYPETHNNLGVALGRQGKPQDAIPHFERALKLKPNFPEAHNNLAGALTTLNRLPEAIQHYDLAARLNPDFAEAHFQLARILLQQGRTSEAIRHYEMLSRLWPENAEVHNELGFALGKQGKLSEAVLQFAKSVKIKPEFADAENNWGIALVLEGRSTEAIPHFRKALELATAQGNAPLAEAVRARLASLPAASPPSQGP